MLQRGVVGRVVLAHHPVTVGAAEVEDVVWILLEESEVVVHRVRQKFGDGAWVLPPPLRIEMRVADDVERRMLRQVGWIRSARQRRAREHRQQYKSPDHFFVTTSISL